jgi:hypothetical protein
MTIRYPKLSAIAIAAFGVLRAELAAMPKTTVDECLAVDWEVSGILEHIADAVECTDSLCGLMDLASDIVGSVEKSRERIAMYEADELERRRAA